jgi:hypothetical protein
MQIMNKLGEDIKEETGWKYKGGYSRNIATINNTK